MYTTPSTVKNMNNYYIKSYYSYILLTGRVWVFVAVCEGLLESYIRLFLEGQKDAKKFYTK